MTFRNFVVVLPHLPAADEAPGGIGELHRCVRRADGVNGVRFGLGRNTRLGQTECLKSACARARRPSEIAERVLDEEVPVRMPQTRMIEIVAIVAGRLSRDPPLLARRRLWSSARRQAAEHASNGARARAAGLLCTPSHWS